MQEILFRGKKEAKSIVDAIRNKWIFGYYLQNKKFDTMPHTIFNIENGEFESVLPESVGQFINSNDMDNNKIFNGDIVEAPSGVRFVVKWKEEELRWAMQSIEGVWLNMNCSILKVVGNMTDNPEMFNDLTN